jgi:hypothetical protein
VAAGSAGGESPRPISDMTGSSSLVHLRPNGKDAKYRICEWARMPDKKGGERLEQVASKTCSPDRHETVVICLAPGQSLHVENCRVEFR